jgi:hypothetical protein
MVLKRTLNIQNINWFIVVCILLVSQSFGQTNNIENPDIIVKQLEDLYSLKLAEKPKLKYNIGGQIFFDKDQFGAVKRVITYSAFKITF